MTIQIPQKVNSIIHTLQKHGHEAYAVGGCVRDSLLGRIPNDWDITTSAKPEEVKALFHRTIDTGIQHGTVTVMIEKEGFEVTTYRIDGEYTDSRHPKEVIFTPDLQEDLRRRDFTINAMAYNEEQGLVDCIGGREDLEKRIIRCVGNAEERFSEDALRILRALRFAAQLGCSVEADTMSAIRKLAPTLANISAERIQAELLKMLVSPNPSMMRTVYETGISAVIMPEWDAVMETDQNHPHHKYSVGEHTIHAMEAVKPQKVYRLAMLFHDFGKPLVKTTDKEGIDHFYGHADVSAELAETIMRRLKFDNDTMETVCKLVKYHDYRPSAAKKGVRKGMAKTGQTIFPMLFPVMRADTLAQSEHMRAEKLAYIDKLEELYEQVLADGECVSLKMLAITGRDLLDNGFSQGKQIGVVLNQLLEIVLEEPEKNNREYLLQKAKEYLS